MDKINNLSQSRSNNSTYLNPINANLEDIELYELACLSGCQMDVRIFRILLDLLRLNVPPENIINLLKTILSIKSKQQ